MYNFRSVKKWIKGNKTGRFFLVKNAVDGKNMLCDGHAAILLDEDELQQVSTEVFSLLGTISESATQEDSEVPKGLESIFENWGSGQIAEPTGLEIKLDKRLGQCGIFRHPGHLIVARKVFTDMMGADCIVSNVGSVTPLNFTDKLTNKPLAVILPVRIDAEEKILCHFRGLMEKEGN